MPRAKKETKAKVVATEVEESSAPTPEELRREYLLECLETWNREGWTKVGQIEAELSKLNAIL